MKKSIRSLEFLSNNIIVSGIILNKKTCISYLINNCNYKKINVRSLLYKYNSEDYKELLKLFTKYQLSYNLFYKTNDDLIRLISAIEFVIRCRKQATGEESFCFCTWFPYNSLPHNLIKIELCNIIENSLKIKVQ